VVQGRWLSAEDVEVIRGLIGGHPHWSRRQISIAVSEAYSAARYFGKRDIR